MILFSAPLSNLKLLGYPPTAAVGWPQSAFWLAFAACAGGPNGVRLGIEWEWFGANLASVRAAAPLAVAADRPLRCDGFGIASSSRAISVVAASVNQVGSQFPCRVLSASTGAPLWLPFWLLCCCLLGGGLTYLAVQAGG